MKIEFISCTVVIALDFARSDAHGHVEPHVPLFLRSELSLLGWLVGESVCARVDPCFPSLSRCDTSFQWQRQ